MGGIKEILDAWHGAGGASADAVLATVVHVTGSAYRRPGARMLLLADGRRIGTISGGCLDGEVAKKAAWWTSAHPVALRSFDSSTEDAAWDFGLGCNGVVSVLLERADAPGLGGLFEFVGARQAGREEAVVATVIRCAGQASPGFGGRVFWGPSGLTGGSLCDTALAARLSPAVRLCFAERESRLVHLDDADVFVEWIGPPQRLVILGGGHDVIPLVDMAGPLGWNVTVADARPAYVRPERFPLAEKTWLIPSSCDISELEIDPDTAVVMMTHNYHQDVRLLPQVLARNPCYVGILGSRLRTESLFAEADVALAENVRSPVGLDIGTDHPETIALSIAAEIQSVLSGRPGGPLRMRKEAVHDAVKEMGRAGPGAALGENAAIAACEVSHPD